MVLEADVFVTRPLVGGQGVGRVSIDEFGRRAHWIT